MTINPLARKFSHFVDLERQDVEALDDLLVDVRVFRAKETLIAEGDSPQDMFLLLEGWGCRYKILEDGRRQIVAYLVPGDLCDVHVGILREMDHCIGLLSDARVAVIPSERILALLRHHPVLADALRWSTLVDEAVLREWLVNIGQRSARDRMAHLFVELWHRLDAVGQTSGDDLALPITQEALADTMGLTPVHVNRTLQDMRADGLIELQGGRLRLRDMRRLVEVSGFDPNYLHLQRRAAGDAGFRETRR